MWISNWQTGHNSLWLISCLRISCSSYSCQYSNTSMLIKNTAQSELIWYTHNGIGNILVASCSCQSETGSVLFSVLLIYLWTIFVVLFAHFTHSYKSTNSNSNSFVNVNMFRYFDVSGQRSGRFYLMTIQPSTWHQLLIVCAVFEHVWELLCAVSDFWYRGHLGK